MPKAYSYLRFSTPEQMKGDSFRRQSDLASAYCAQHGLALDTEVTYHDLGVSAFRGKNAEAGRLAEFLEAVKAGLIEGGSFLLVESLDRISRQAARKALRVLEAICEEGITVVTLSDAKVYTQEALDSDPMSLIMSLLIFIRSNEESAMKSKRLKAAWLGKRARIGTEPLTAKCPGWLKLDEDRKWLVIEERAKVVRNIFKAAACGTGAHSIAEDLNRQKVPIFGKGTQWHRSYILKLIDNPTVVGTYVPKVIEFIDGKKVRKPQEPVPGYFPAIVPDDLYQQVRSMRTKSASPLRGKAVQIRNIFAGLVRCARCGSSMTLQNKGATSGKSPYYLVCSKARYGAGCKYTAIRYGEVEGFFLHDAPRILSFTPSRSEDTERQQSELVAAIETLDARRANLMDGFERTRDQAMLERYEELGVELKDRKSALAELVARIDATEGPLVAKRIAGLRKLIDGKTPSQLDKGLVNASIRALFSGLSLNPESGVATIGWKHGGESTFTFAWPEEPIAHRESA